MTVPRGAGAGGAARAVQVGLVLDRRVGVDDERDVVDVDAAGGDVGGDQGAAPRPAWNAVQVAGAGVLAQVAVQLDRGHARGVELAGELLGAVLGAGEDHGAAGRGGEVDQHGQAARRRVTCSTWWAIVETGDCAESAWWVTGLCRKRFDDDVDAAVERGGEQHPLAVDAGSASSRRRTPGRKPRSAMWSASSRTVISTASRRTWPWPMRSSSRPGQATTMSTPRRRPLDLRVLADAAEDGARGQAERPRPAAPAPRRSGSPSSRVGARIRARGLRGWRGLPLRGEAGHQRAAGRRRSCRSRCGHGRARRDRRGSRAASRPGSGWGR